MTKSKQIKSIFAFYFKTYFNSESPTLWRELFCFDLVVDSKGNSQSNVGLFVFGDSMDTQELKFWSKVKVTANPDKCWEWKIVSDPKGYATTYWNGKTVGVHKIAFMLNGGIIKSGQIVRHLVCRNPRCCNPRHLAVGTHKDNYNDARNDGTNAQGSRHGLSKLTESDIPLIFALREQGISLELIAKEFGVSYSTVGRVLKGEAWSHIEDYGARITPKTERGKFERSERLRLALREKKRTSKEVPCSRCGKLFYRNLYALTNSKNNYCSKPCYWGRHLQMEESLNKL